MKIIKLCVSPDIHGFIKFMHDLAPNVNNFRNIEEQFALSALLKVTFQSGAVHFSLCAHLGSMKRKNFSSQFMLEDVSHNYLV